MATTASGWSYAVPNDTLVAWPAVSQAVADKLETNIANYAPGLALIKTQTIGTAVSSVTVTNAFSSTYDNYRIIVNGGTPSGTNSVGMQLGATATGYATALIYQSWGTPTTITGFGNSNTTSFYRAGAFTTDGISLDVDLQNPYLTKKTIAKGTWIWSDTAQTAGNWNGFLNNTTSYTDFTITPAAGTWTGGTIYVYGYRKA